MKSFEDNLLERIEKARDAVEKKLFAEFKRNPEKRLETGQKLDVLDSVMFELKKAISS